MFSYRDNAPSMDQRQRDINEGMYEQQVVADKFDRMYEHYTHKEDENADNGEG